jgi:hypothetical protein
MAYVPYASRRIPAAVAADEVILTVPRPVSRGGDGRSAAHFTAAGGSATTITITEATGYIFNDFEAAATTTADRYNGLRLTVNGRSTIITDHATAAGTTTLIFVTGSIPAGASGQDGWIESDIPLHVSLIQMKTTAAVAIHYSIQNQAGLITAGQFARLLATDGTVELLFDAIDGAAGFPIRVAGASATTLELVVYAP